MSTFKEAVHENIKSRILQTSTILGPKEGGVWYARKTTTSFLNTLPNSPSHGAHHVHKRGAEPKDMTVKLLSFVY
jgi:hypothetical protein